VVTSVYEEHVFFIFSVEMIRGMCCMGRMEGCDQGEVGSSEPVMEGEETWIIYNNNNNPWRYSYDEP
jgi:hypothetical protein